MSVTAHDATHGAVQHLLEHAPHQDPGHPPQHAPHDTILHLLEHASHDGVEHFPGANVFFDNPAVRVEEFTGTDGQVDVFVFDAAEPLVNSTQLRNFDPGEDFLLFTNMGGRDLIAGDLGNSGDGTPIGSNFVLFHSNGASANILLFGVPYQQSAIEQMVLPFDGRLVFDDPFAVI